MQESFQKSSFKHQNSTPKLPRVIPIAPTFYSSTELHFWHLCEEQTLTNQGIENLWKYLSKFKSKDKRAPEKRYTGYIFTGSESEEQCTDVWWGLWPVLMNTPMATLTVPWLKPLRAAFRATPTKEPQQFCPECLPIYKEHHSPSLRKRLGKGHVSKMQT